jgi:hypothetical protein
VRLSPAIIRKIIPCPKCGVMLSWPKLPYRLMMVGTFLFLFQVIWVGLSRMESIGWELSLLIPLGLAVVGAFGLRVEVHQSNDVA